MSKIVAVTNQKAGGGKTTTAINLAAALAPPGRRPLLLDMHPQANATSGIGCKGLAASAGTIYDALTANDPGADAGAYLLPTSVDRLKLVPSSRDLAGAELELIAM